MLAGKGDWLGREQELGNGKEKSKGEDKGKDKGKDNGKARTKAKQGQALMSKEVGPQNLHAQLQWASSI